MIVTILSPTVRNNALGRATSLADLAMSSGAMVRIFGPNDGTLWAGARLDGGEVLAYDSHDEVTSTLSAETGPHIVWVVKPLETSWVLGTKLRQALSAQLVVDFDDDDEALSTEFRRRSVTGRLRLTRRNPLHPARIRRTIQSAYEQADAFTVATHALAVALDMPRDRPLLRVPHPRRVSGVTSGEVHRGFHLGFLGTPRSHKGLDILLKILERHPDTVLHIFEGAVAESLIKPLRGRVIQHLPDAPMEHLYGSIDAVLLPQSQSAGAQLQLPAKMLDAMRFGVPVVATNTTAVAEIAGESVIFIRDWNDNQEVDRALRACRLSGREIGALAKARFDLELSLESQSPQLEAFLARLIE